MFLLDIESLIMFFFSFCRDLDIYTEMDEFTEMLKVSSLRRFVTINFLPHCLSVALTIDLLHVCRQCSFLSGRSLIFFFPLQLHIAAGNVLLTEDGTVKLGKVCH